MATQNLAHGVDAGNWDQAFYAVLAEKERRSGSMRTVATLALNDALCFLRSFDMPRSSSTVSAVVILEAGPSLNQVSENPDPFHYTHG